ncbi:MAG: NAD(P)H-hydrate dehydratase [Deltaproteobacteria bacterium]|nr:NAD(P)H-hydrate dehydratase [Deltaproteobacteria bacterium]
MFLVTAAEMREMDRRTIESFGLPGRILMENAGRGAVRVMRAYFPGIASQRVGILAGRGNNGGDGFVIARRLACMGVDVSVFLLSKRSRVVGDAGANLALLDPLGVPVFEIEDPAALRKKKPAMRRREVWVDALLGTGLNADVRGHFREAIDFVNRADKPVVAVDVPSGLNADTGQICGTCIRAKVTVTFAFAKLGCAVFPGAACCGALEVVDIGIPPFITAAVNPRQVWITPAGLRPLLRQRAPDVHKGTTGHLMVVAGSPGKTGAASMSAMAAMRAGAGLVTLGVPAGLNGIVEPQVTEAMTVPLPETVDGLLDSSALRIVKAMLPGKRCVAFGPGIGTGDGAGRFLAGLIESSPIPLVIDADGINLLAGNPGMLKKARAAVTITPHPGEMARLLGTTPAQVQEDRVGCARDVAARYGVHVVLKGAATVIAHPEGNVHVNQTGNPGMASGGMGDILTGLVAGFTVQGYSVDAAARLGVYLHGRAADTLAAAKGPVGFLATEVMNRIPEEIRLLATNSFDA